MRSDAGNESSGGLAFSHARVAQVRIARPTDRLEEVVAFYRDGLGLPELTRFTNHEGYDGVMLGLPDATYHLEFTQHSRGSPCSAPSADNLLVLYIPDATQLGILRERLERRGHRPVAPENPYWLQNSVTFQDPDGWRVVLCNTHGV
jgi:catechol 2,3-dioxygenase-like lactoylglutathione lyase family enzyme